jgi:hypothetical protein
MNGLKLCTFSTDAKSHTVGTVNEGSPKGDDCEADHLLYFVWVQL